MKTTKQRIEYALRSAGFQVADYLCDKGVAYLDVAFINDASYAHFSFFVGNLTIHEHVARILKAHKVSKPVVVKKVSLSSGKSYENAYRLQHRPIYGAKFEEAMRSRFGCQMQLIWSFDKSSDRWAVEIQVLRPTQRLEYIEKELTALFSFARQLAERNKEIIGSLDLSATFGEVCCKREGFDNGSMDNF